MLKMIAILFFEPSTKARFVKAEERYSRIYKLTLIKAIFACAQIAITFENIYNLSTKDLLQHLESLKIQNSKLKLDIKVRLIITIDYQHIFLVIVHIE